MTASHPPTHTLTAFVSGLMAIGAMPMMLGNLSTHVPPITAPIRLFW